jgi:GWxTD domain-containing protein
MTTKQLLFLVLLLIGFNLYSSEQLGMFIDAKRYQDNTVNTKYVIDYQVPYKNLQFMTRNKSFYAELRVVLSIANADSVIFSREFINDIGVSKKYDLASDSKFYPDRISLTLSQPRYKLKIEFSDLNSDKSYVWEYITEQLSSLDLLSDLEIVASVLPDSTLFAKKFIRFGKTQIPCVSGIVSKGTTDSIYVYCEAYNDLSPFDRAVLTVSRDSTISMIQSLNLKSLGNNKALFFPINITGLETGKYTIAVELRGSQNAFVRAVPVILTEQSEKTYSIFNDIEEEFLFLRYLTPVNTVTHWDTMSKDAKRRYISGFWLAKAAESNQPVESIMDFYKKRIDYCNTRFSHFEKGWKTDMGRIYIRNGPPDEIDSDTTTDETKYVRKDFQIWKYSGKNHPVYVFVDIPMNGNFKLVYAENDEQESTYLNWKKYLGSDFDESRLQN